MTKNSMPTFHLRKSLQGYTLIEVMIVVAIIAVLAAIAYPSYKESVLKGRRAEARAALTNLLQQQERYMSQNNTYFAFDNVNGTTTPSTVPFTTKTEGGSSPAYWLSAKTCEEVDGGGNTTARTCIRVVATPATTDPRVGPLTLASTGHRDCTPDSAYTKDMKLCWP